MFTITLSEFVTTFLAVMSALFVFSVGLDPVDKAERVRHYVDNMVREVAIIAHSCGAAEPRQLRREHCRIVVGPGRSAPLNELYGRVKQPIHKEAA